MATKSVARDRSVNNVVFGAGEIHIDPYGDDGKLTGERYLGSTPGFTLNIQAERTQAFDDDGPAATMIVNFVRQIDRSFGFQCKNVDDENAALFIAGTAEEIDISNSAVVDEEVGPVRQGRSYILGKKAARQLGIQHAPNPVVVTNDDASQTFEASTSTTKKAYAIDNRGRIYIETAKDNGAANAATESATNIPDGTELKIDYTPKDTSYIQVKSGDKQIRAAIHYIEDPAAGVRRDFYAVNCNIGASGEFAVKSRENAQTMSFEAAIQEPTEAGVASLVIATVPA